MPDAIDQVTFKDSYLLKIYLKSALGISVKFFKKPIPLLSMFNYI